MKQSRVVLYVALLAVTPVLMAQTKSGDVVADIPFSFVAGERHFPAGHYIVSPVNESILRIEGSGHQDGFVGANLTQRPASDNRCKLVFHRYGDSYFLAQVWTTGNPRGRELPRSRAERELAAKAAAMENAIVAAR